MVEILGSNNKGPKIGSISGGNNGNMNSIQNGDHANLSDPDNNTEVDDEESNYVLQQVTCTKFLNSPALFCLFENFAPFTKSRNPLDIKRSLLYLYFYVLQMFKVFTVI